MPAARRCLGTGRSRRGAAAGRSPSRTAIPKVLQQIASEIGSQYKITYTLPDGQKPSDRVQVTTKRRGTLRSPSRISDKS